MITLLALFVGKAKAEQLPLGLYAPSAPIGPDAPSTCDAYEDLWEAIRKRIHEAHERCLEDNRGDARVEDGRCSVGACEELHAPERWGVREVEACRDAVRAAQEAKRAAERRAAEEEAARRAAEEEARRVREAAEARARAEAERRAAEAEAKRQREEEARRASEEREAAERAQRIAAARAESQRAQDDHRARVAERERERDTLHARGELLRERADEERQRLDVAATGIVDALGASAPINRLPLDSGADDLDWGPARATRDAESPVEKTDPTILSYEEIGMSNVTRRQAPVPGGDCQEWRTASGRVSATGPDETLYAAAVEGAFYVALGDAAGNYATRPTHLEMRNDSPYPIRVVAQGEYTIAPGETYRDWLAIARLSTGPAPRIVFDASVRYCPLQAWR